MPFTQYEKSFTRHTYIRTFPVRAACILIFTHIHTSYAPKKGYYFHPHRG